MKFNCPSHPALNALASHINSEAAIGGGGKVPPCLLAAIVKRETGGRNIFQAGMPHADGCGVGLCQITDGVCWDDPANPTFSGYNLLDPAANLYVASAYFLKGLVEQAEAAKAAHPNAFAVACRGQLAFAVAVGYNAGFGAVQTALALVVDADRYTTDGYGADVFQTYCDFVAESHKHA